MTFNLKMEVLKDYPKEFAKLFQWSFNFLSRINIKFFFKNEDFVGKYWRFLYIIPCLVINYVGLGYNVGTLVAKGQIIEIAYLLPPFLISTQAVSFGTQSRIKKLMIPTHIFVLFPAILKAIIIFPKSSLLATIIKELGALWRIDGLDETQKNTKDKLLKGVRLCNRVTYWIGIIGSSQYLMTPLAETLVRRFVMKQNGVMLLPIGSSYPFDPKRTWSVYGAIYVFQTYSMFLCVFVYVGAELLMITLCALLGVEFTLLCEDMLCVKPESKEQINECQEIDSASANLKVEVTIRDIVKRHQKLCVLTAQLDEAFNMMTFVDLLFTGLTTCFFIYAAQYSRGLTYTIINYTAVLASLLYVLYLCYYGELLTAASLRVGDMAYHNLWYKGNKRYRQAIYIIIMRSQKPCCLTSLKYAPITLNMFTKVISSTWSYLSLMNTVYGEES